MSARIAPRADTMGIAFSPHLPRFLRQDKREDQNDSDKHRQNEAEPQALPAGRGGVATEASLPPETIFEAALLGNQQALDPPSAYEVARRLRNEWSPPTYGFKLTDKTI
ncbi:hypothetical protein ASD83_01555 [Devosia sp. Root685]|uniref:hypothetical protein n=1 Tax=Devosia sp. Root685 TaxID=1736587 RepID=UPI0006F60E99|nr:hypothetical protein [Devosia sp. Root685]KRA99242.1 hypothetical protein ASD83_01555 [Devosia sp. Root685]